MKTINYYTHFIALPTTLTRHPPARPCMSDSASLYLCQHLVLPLVFILGILIGVCRYLIVISIHISLMVNEFGHLCMCLFVNLKVLK